MQLIYNEERQRYEFLYTKPEMGVGYALVADNFRFDGACNPKVWYTTEARRCLKTVETKDGPLAPASFADDQTRERILGEAKGAPDPEACRIEWHAALRAPKAGGRAGFTWHAPYVLNPFVKGRGWTFTKEPHAHWWTADAANVAATARAIEEFNTSVKEASRVKLHVGESARAEIAAQMELKQASIVASRATDAVIDIPCPEGLAYLPFQRAGIAFCLGRPAVLLGDDMGLGKTIQAIGAINADPEARQVLIVVPASLKVNWRRELEKWSVRATNIMIISGSPNSAGDGLIGRLFDVVRGRKRTEVDVAVINFDILHKWEAALVAHGWDLFIVDEAHKAKGGKKTKRGKACLMISKVSGRKLLLTGTPIPNRVSELLPLLEILDAVGQFGGSWKFLEKYCGAHNNGFGWQFDGAANLDELNERLRASVMIRRLKTEVLKELPHKRRQVIELPAANAEQRSLIAQERNAEQRKRELKEELRARVELAKASDDPGEYARAVSALKSGMKAAFDEMSKLRHETALAKLPQAIEHIEDVLEGTHKIVVGAHHRDVIEKLMEHFNRKRTQAVKLYGGMNEEDKQMAVDRFQLDPTCRIFVGSIMAAGVGLTLTAASTVVLVELDWVPANVSQFEDRVLRIGQEADSVLVQHLVLEGSLDARMARTLIQKQEIADRALDHDTGAGQEEVALPDDGDEDALELELPEKREAGYAPEDVTRVRWSAPEYEDRAATHGITQERLGIEALKMTAESIALVYQALNELASVCDGAVTRDTQGFNGTDSKIGRALASRPLIAFSPKAAALGKHIIRKYRQSQLGGRYDSLFE